MAANILTRDIQVGTEMGWHGLTKIEADINKGNCGIVYPMAKRQLFIPNGDELIPTEHYSIVSLDDNLPIGNPVKKGYKLISNEQFMDMIEKALEGTSHKIVSVGSIGDREKVFCSVKLSENFIAAGRDTESVLNVLWGHGGVASMGYRTGFTVVVCANTYAIALREGKTKLEKQKHTGNAELKLENIGLAIEDHVGVAAEFKRAMDDMAGTSISKTDSRALFAGFLVRDFDKLEGEVPTRTENTISRLQTLFNNGAGNGGANRADVFNAFTDYYTHESSGGEESETGNRWKQLESSEFGSGFNRKTEAYDLLRDIKVPKLGDMTEVLTRGEKVLQLI